MDAEDAKRAYRHRPFGKNYFRQRIVYAWELPSVMRKHIYTGVMGSIHGTLVTGIFFVYFGTLVGLSDFQWGLLAGISSWVIAIQPISALVTERTGNRKRIWFHTAFIDRSLRLVGILLALGLWLRGAPASGVVLLIAVVLANFFGTIGVPPWLSWLADIIPEEQHGSFWGRRSAWVSLFTVASLLSAALIADLVPADRKVYAITAVFIVATVIGIADVFIHGTIPEPRMRLPEPDHPMRHFLRPLKDPKFRPWIVFNSAWTFSMTLGGALSTLYFVEHLGIKENLFGGTAVTSGVVLIAGTLTGRSAGRLVDRHGVGKMLKLGHLFWSVLPLFWLFATSQTALIFLAVASLIGGVSSTTATISANKLITRFPPAEFRTMYIAVSTSLGSIAGGLGPVVAGVVLRASNGASIEIGGTSFGGFHLLFAVSALFRLLSTLILIPRIDRASDLPPDSAAIS